MLRSAFFPIALLFLSRCVAAHANADPQNAPKPTPQIVTQDTAVTSLAGATFTLPAGWSMTSEVSSNTLQPPEPDTHLILLEERAPDAATAVANAWRSYRPNWNRPLKVAMDLPAREGWSLRKQFIYETSPNERAVVLAVAFRAGDTWTVLLADGTEPTFEKRGAQVNLIVESLRPKGYHRESFAGIKAHRLTPERIQILKSFVESSMKTLTIPGASMALIEDGKVVYEGGFGVRKLGDPTPVNEHTRFMVASNTKGMTTLLLARLIDQDKLNWDEPVTQAYPGFRLGSGDTTRQVEIKHLICACTGMPRQDFEWLFQFKSYTPESTFMLLGHMQPTSRFGEVFQYSNLMASAAGYIGAHLYEPSLELGPAYDKAMKHEIFDPLGMTESTFDMEQAQRGNFASPHGDDIDQHPSLAGMDTNYSVVPFRPAGGLWSSAHDMTRYALLELSRGKLPTGEQFVSEENLLMRRKPQISTGEDETYGMGLEVYSRWGIPIVHHGGSMFGYKSDWMIIPDAGVGAVLLTNADNGGMLLYPFRRRLVEVLYDGKPEAVGDLESAGQNYRAYMSKERQRLIVPASAAETAKLAVHYTNEALGSIKVEHQGTNTVFHFDGWQSTVASRKNDDGTISFVTIDPTRDGFAFVRAERNVKRSLVVRDAQHEYVFTETD
jgi:CubicO group peptidase (beta-lactamase class C family)